MIRCLVSLLQIRRNSIRRFPLCDHVVERMAGSSDSKELEGLLKENPSLNVTCEGRKVKCSLSGHEMPCRVEVIKSYTQGKKYQQLVAKQNLELEKYKDVLVKSNKRGHERQMFCKLTLRHLNIQPHHIQRHIDGKRFQKAYKRWLECKKTGEPFKPRLGQKRPRVDSEDESGRRKETWEGDGSSSEEESEDNMSDLYPDADFQEDEEEEEEEEDDDEEESEDSELDMDTEDSPPPSKAAKPVSTGNKSKSKQSPAPSKAVTKASSTPTGEKSNKRTKSKTKTQPKKKVKVRR